MQTYTDFLYPGRDYVSRPFSRGITIRQHFALEILNTMVARYGTDLTPTSMSKDAVILTDALLKELTLPVHDSPI